MAESRKVLKVFIASPGDLADERRAAKQVVDRFNLNWSERLGYHVELVGWEDTVAVFGRPQSVINEDLAKCELFIGMIWRKWGTAPGGEYTSGFEEEFQSSIERRIKSGKPEISLYFKEVDQSLLSDPGDDLKKVLTFKERVTQERKIIFKTFADLSKFREEIESCIAAYVWRLKTSESEGVDQAAAEKPPENPAAQSAEYALSDDSLLSVEGVAFATEFVRSAKLANGIPSAAEVARFRLLGTVIGDGRNSEFTLGVHDANLVFGSRGIYSLGDAERRGLEQSGLVHFEEEVVPYWHWYASRGGFQRNHLSFWTLAPKECLVGAFKAMRLINAPLCDPGMIPRIHFVRSWLEDGKDSAAKIAALNYLADCGLAEDREEIKREFDKAESQTSAASANALIRINLRLGNDVGVTVLNELQPDTIPASLKSYLLDAFPTLADELLLQCLSHKSSDVRLCAAKELRSRGSLDISQAETLLADYDTKVRVEALRAMSERGQIVSDERAKQVLDRHADQKFGFFKQVDSDSSEFNKFRRWKLLHISVGQLLADLPRDNAYSRDVYFALCEREFSKRGDELRQQVSNGFQNYFDDHEKYIQTNYAKDAAFIEKVRGLRGYVCKSLVRRGLSIIEQKGGKQDLDLVRELASTGKIDLDAGDLSFLAKYGAWRDVNLIVKNEQKILSASSVWYERNESTLEIYADTLLRLAKSRAPALIDVGASATVLTTVIRNMAKKRFAEISEANILSLLLVDNDKLRRMVCLRLISVWPRARLKKLLDRYMDDGQKQFYNVIYWLDFGASVPKDVITGALKNLEAGKTRSAVL